MIRLSKYTCSDWNMVDTLQYNTFAIISESRVRPSLKFHGNILTNVSLGLKTLWYDTDTLSFAVGG